MTMATMMQETIMRARSNLRYLNSIHYGLFLSTASLVTIKQAEWAHFTDIPSTEPQHPDSPDYRPGVYNSRMFRKPGTEENGIHVIILDNRSQRDPTFSRFGQCKGSETKMMGQDQWSWLEAELDRESEIKIIGSGVQVLPPTDIITRIPQVYCAHDIHNMEDTNTTTFMDSLARVGEGKQWYGVRYEMWYESREFKNLDQTIVSCKYFDKEFTNYEHLENWYDIPTPFFQSILEYQKFDSNVSKWMYVMGGRLCFAVNDIDTWQVIPFLKGIARSGKSTLITKVFRKFYNADDVRTLSNNVEKKFGLSSIYDAFMFIAPEVKGDLQLEQAEFQSIVSGEDVSIAVKHEKAKSFEWTTPGILGGNEVPNWKDNSGSVLRRILTWNFGKQVKDADPTLEYKLDAELPIILQKCIRAYLEYAQKYADRDIWNVVPEYFKAVQKQVATVASTLENFMQSTGVNYGKELFCPQKEFVALFNSHCQANNLGKPRFTQDFYVGPFSQREIEVREVTLTYKGRNYPRQAFIFGLDIVNDDATFANDY